MIILDSNIWVALLYNDDSLHMQAEVLLASLTGEICVPEYVIGEVCTVLLLRKDIALADQFAEKMLAQKECRIVYSNSFFVDHILHFFREHISKRLSFIDTSLLYLSQEYTVYTFDKHLAKAIKKMEGKRG